MNLIDLTHSPYRYIVVLIVFSTVLGCGTEGDISTLQYPGAPTITIKLTSRSTEKVEYYLESDVILPYDLTVGVRAQGTCTAEGKTHNFDGDWDFPVLNLGTEMHRDTVRKHFVFYFSPFWSRTIRELLETNVNGPCL